MISGTLSSAFPGRATYRIVVIRAGILLGERVEGLRASERTGRAAVKSEAAASVAASLLALPVADRLARAVERRALVWQTDGRRAAPGATNTSTPGLAPAPV